MLTMKCPDCQEDLVAIPTSHGPGLDIFSSRHGLWLDVGVVNFFVEDYTSLKRRLVTPEESLLSTPLSGRPWVFCSFGIEAYVAHFYIRSSQDHESIARIEAKRTYYPDCDGKRWHMEQEAWHLGQPV